MEGPSHVGFTLASSVCVNSTLYALFPHSLTDGWEYVLHAFGRPYTYLDLVNFWYHPTLLMDSSIPIVLLHKATFYVLLGFAASFPDQWERREPGAVSEDEAQYTTLLEETEMAGPDPIRSHRTFTHSLVLWILIASIFGLIYIVGMRYLYLNHIVLAGWIIEEGCIPFLVLLFALLFHVIGDMFTKKGVKVLWPDNTPYGFGPRRWRFKNKSWREYALLWGTMIVTTVLLSRGIVGI